MSKTNIEWSDSVWNPTTGCQKVSPGCKYCFAETMHARLHAMGLPKYERDFDHVVFHPGELGKPLSWRKPCRIFVNSMSDLFHPSVTNEQIAAVYGVMAACPQHTFQVLTKRPERAVKWYEWINHEARFVAATCGARTPSWHCMMQAAAAGLTGWGRIDQWPLPNVHLLTSCEDQQHADERIPLLLKCPAAVRGVSLEPLLGPISLTGEYLASRCGGRYPFEALGAEHRTKFIDLLDWIIAGAESGPGRRPCEVEWILDLARQCKEAGVPFFNKQMSIGGKVVKDMAQFPAEARVRMYPGDRWEERS